MNIQKGVIMQRFCNCSCNCYSSTMTTTTIGFIYETFSRKYTIYRSEQVYYDWIMYGPNEELKQHCHRQQQLQPKVKILQGEPLIIDKNTRIWSVFRSLESPYIALVFGLNFDHQRSDLNVFTICTEPELRFKYQQFKALNMAMTFEAYHQIKRYLNSIYGAPQSDFYERIFQCLAILNERDCLTRCFVRDIWHLRDALKTFMIMSKKEIEISNDLYIEIN